MALSAHSRRFVVVVAHVVLLAYFFQISAIDHWHSHFDVVGVPESNAHVMHCHGAASGCADGATVSPIADATAMILIPPAARVVSIDPSVAVLGSAFVASPDQPPRAA